MRSRRKPLLDGLDAVRTSLPQDTLAENTAVKTNKSSAMVGAPYRRLKTVDLHVRPIHHWLEDRVRAHTFLRMLAYYVELAHARAPSADARRRRRQGSRRSPARKPGRQGQRSAVRLRQGATGRAAEVPPSILPDPARPLATLARNTVVTANAPDRPFTILTRPTPIQQKLLRPPGFPIAYPVAAPPKRSPAARSIIMLRERKKLGLNLMGRFRGDHGLRLGLRRSRPDDPVGEPSLAAHDAVAAGHAEGPDHGLARGVTRLALGPPGSDAADGSPGRLRSKEQSCPPAIPVARPPRPRTDLARRSR